MHRLPTNTIRLGGGVRLILDAATPNMLTAPITLQLWIADRFVASLPLQKGWGQGTDCRLIRLLSKFHIQPEY